MHRDDESIDLIDPRFILNRPIDPDWATRPFTPSDFLIPYKPTFTIAQVAGYFEVSARTIYREVEDGVLRAAKIRGKLRVTWDDLCAYLRRPSANPAAIDEK